MMIKRGNMSVGDVFFMKHAKCDHFDCKRVGNCENLIHGNENCKGIIKITRIVDDGRVMFTSQRMKEGMSCTLLVESDEFYKYNEVETEE